MAYASTVNPAPSHVDHDAAADHLLAQLNAARTAQQPFAHFTQTDCLPTAYFAELMRLWPNQDQLVSLPLLGRTLAHRYKERFVAPLNPASFALMAAEQAEFFSAFAAWFTGPAVVDAFLARFGQPPGRRLAVDVVLAEDRAGYAIPPHTDSPEKLFTALFYCHGQPHSGTALYTPLDEALVGRTEIHHDRRQFTEAGRAPFHPNAMFAFLRTDNSFHGVDPLAAEDAPRRTIQYTCYFDRLPDRFVR